MLLAVLILSACGPKYSYVKTKFANEKPKVENVLLVLDYVSLKDDVGELWDYKEDYNIKHMDKTYNEIKNSLQAKGYNILDTELKASGLLMEDEYQAEHYKGGKLKDDLISPPFMINFENYSDQQINDFRDLNLEVREHLGNGIISEVKTYNYGLLPNLENLRKMELPKNTAIIVINANRPKISAVKAIGVGVLSAALTGGYLIVSSHGVPSTFGYMIHADTGDILWTNFGSNVKFTPKSTYFKELPILN